MLDTVVIHVKRSVVYAVTIAALVASLVSCAPRTSSYHYEPWDGPVERLVIAVENTQRGLLQLVSEDELYPLALTIALGNPYVSQRFDIVNDRGKSDCDYRLIIRFVNGSFTNVSPPSFSLGKTRVKLAGKLISVDLTGRLVSCKTGRVLLSSHSNGAFFYLGNINIDYRDLMSTPGVEQVMEGTINASKKALRDLIREIMGGLANG